MSLADSMSTNITYSKRVIFDIQIGNLITNGIVSEFYSQGSKYHLPPRFIDPRVRKIKNEASSHSH